MLNLTDALSDISRTNQLKVTSTPAEVAENLFQYLYKKGKGIEYFILDKEWQANRDDLQSGLYEARHKYIKEKVRERLSEYGEKPNYSDIQYYVSYSNGETHVFFLSPNKDHSGWKELFCTNWNTNRERIFNLIFKFYILSKSLSIETINGFEELLLTHTKSTSKSKDALFIWGQNVYINYNPYHVLTLTLSRKQRLFLPKDQYNSLDGDDLGEMQVYQKKKYYYKRDLDGRRKNPINFMRFDKDDEDYNKFKKTQLYYFQKLMTELESFLRECNISFIPLLFQSDCYLDNSFINDKNMNSVESLDSLEVINNIGDDLTELDRLFLENFFKHHGVSSIKFYNFGKSISTYEPVAFEEDEVCWRITEILPWSDINLEKGRNYLVFNKCLDEEVGSMAHQREDGFWYSSIDLDNKKKVDFYSQLKRRFNFLESGVFYSMQGINVSKFIAVGNENVEDAILGYTGNKIDPGELSLDCQPFTKGKLLSVEDNIILYSINQADKQRWENFCEKHKIKISPEFQKVLIELGIKSWIREGLVNPELGLPIASQTFDEKQFFAIFVRSPKKQEPKAVAVEFLYKEGYVYIKNVIREMDLIVKRFRFLRTRKTSDKLIDNQQYFVDEAAQSYISCYTDDFYTPTLIGRYGILEEVETGNIKIDRKTRAENSSRLLPLVSYYSGEISPMNRIQDMICFDLKNPTFIQYYVPPKSGLGPIIKRGFKVYHLIGYKYSTFPKEQIPTLELINHPITALHFNTLTQNILKISENSQSSLLQKVAKVLVEN